MTSEASNAQPEQQPAEPIAKAVVSTSVEETENVVKAEEPDQDEAEPAVEGAEEEPSQDFSGMSNDELLEFARGQMILEKFGDAVSAMSTLLERKVPENDNDPLHPSLAEIWVLYGQASYKYANAKLGVLGDEMLKNASSMAQATTAGLVETSNAKIQLDCDEDEWADEDEEEDEQVNEDDVLEDFAMAWEAVETSRVIYSRLPPTHENRLKLAEVHQLLGDMSANEDKYEEAAEDYRENLKIKEELFPSYDRFVSEARYMLATAYEGAEKFEESYAQYEGAIESLQKRQQLLENTIKAGPVAVEEVKPDSSSKGKAKVSAEPTVLHLPIEKAKADLECLITLLPDLKHKLSEIKNRLAKVNPSFSVNTAPSSTSQVNLLQVKKAAPVSTLPVNDISGLVKKRKADDAVDQQKRPKPDGE